MTATTSFPPDAVQRQKARRRVVDAPTRAFHWLFALSFAGAYLSAAIVGLSLWRRKNMAAPMVTRKVDSPGPDLAKRNHLWLGIVLLAAVLTYWTWEWQQSPDGLIPAQSVQAVLRGDHHSHHNHHGKDDGD